MTDRKSPRKGPTLYIEEPDRLAIRQRMKEKSINAEQLADMCGVTPARMSQLLSKPIPKGERRGCTFLAKLQSALDLAQTARRPVALPSEAQRRFEKIAGRMDADALEHWLADGEWTADRSKKD